MKIAISGGCGFVGSNLAIYFKKKYPTYNISVLDNLKRRGSELNIKRLREHEVEFIHGDMRCSEDLDALEGADFFIDASAEPSVLAGISSSQKQLINNNLLSTINALEWCVKNKTKFIFLSTSRVYPIELLESAEYVEEKTRYSWTDNLSIEGLSSKGISESISMQGYRSLYGATKYSSELLIQEYSQFLGLESIINRCGVISGPWQMGKIDQGVVVLWISRHMSKKNLSYIGYGGTGKQVRDIVHIDDLTRLIDIQISNWSHENGKVYNVGGGIENSLSLLEMTSLCQKITGNKIEIEGVNENRPADLRVYVTDNSLVSNAYNWCPEKTNEELFVDTYKWIRKNEKVLKSIIL